VHGGMVHQVSTLGAEPRASARLDRGRPRAARPKDDRLVTYRAHTGASVLAIATLSLRVGSGLHQETRRERVFVDCSHYCELISHAGKCPGSRTRQSKTAEQASPRRIPRCQQSH
jgi:hypothetical protein